MRPPFFGKRCLGLRELHSALFLVFSTVTAVMESVLVTCLSAVTKTRLYFGSQSVTGRGMEADMSRQVALHLQPEAERDGGWCLAVFSFYSVSSTPACEMGMPTRFC